MTGAPQFVLQADPRFAENSGVNGEIHFVKYNRSVLPVITNLMEEEEPVVLIECPRTVGKSTLLNEIVELKGVQLLVLDEPAVRAARRLLINPSLGSSKAFMSTVC